MSEMGLDIELQDENGEMLESVSDPKNSLKWLLPPNDDHTYPMLASIDPYGDTVFNGLQMVMFLPEWAKASARTTEPEALTVAAKVEKLACRCQSEVHLYLKFIGD